MLGLSRHANTFHRNEQRISPQFINATCKINDVSHGHNIGHEAYIAQLTSLEMATTTNVNDQELSIASQVSDDEQAPFSVPDHVRQQIAVVESLADKSLRVDQVRVL